ncbi:YlaH-like protein [Salsuginibacillus halophilus]|uniref:YlaH-like protein n=1 Tax=Salsuginibacillus halophilus TaxID=517424 RepID=A0A2P8HXA4_9BACI|nr:YlaH-like family protein [Salsuginibacillus halophilus]PSL50837.1 YlaH-like protein [Salsuginibacillus halophilus]
MEQEVTQGDLSWVAGLVGIHENMVLGFWLLYLAVTVMSIVVFNLGFARKLPLLKNVIVYAALLFGTFPLTLFAIGMPIVEALIASALVLGIYRLRLKSHKKEQVQESAYES